MMKQLKYMITVVLTFSTFLISCKKGWLDVKPNKTLVVPATIADYQALLDNTTKMNDDQPGLGELSSDNFYLPFDSWQDLQDEEKNSYIWAKNIFAGVPDIGWTNAYIRILNENIALEGVAAIKPDIQTVNAGNNVTGSALFYRSMDLYNLAQLFCKTYNQATAGTDLGLPLRLESDVNKKSIRASVEATYNQVINDLIKAKKLLPITPLYKTRPSKPAVFALLARVYQSMENYPQAKLFADSCLQLFPDLLDYNALNAGASHPFARFNKEVIYHTAILEYTGLDEAIVEPSLYASYQTGDLRKQDFFDSYGQFKGQYTGSASPFGGIATDEVYLIKAESEARAGDAISAMHDLNTVLAKRFVTGTYIPFSATNADDALHIILKERQKELLFRGLRWTDLRRLNNDPRFAKTLQRSLNGTGYTLPPNDAKYVFPIPDDELRLSGIPQNPR